MPKKTPNTPDDYGFAITLLVGIGILAVELVKFFDATPGNELWDGTFVTGAIFAVGLAGVLICVVNYFQHQIDISDVNDRDGIYKEYLGKVMLANRGSTSPTQDRPIGRLQNKVFSRSRIPKLLSSKLPAGGILGTLLGVVVAFGGFKETIGKLVGEDAKLDLIGMITAFGGFEAAFTSSIVALFMAVWIASLHHFNNGLAVQLLDMIEQIIDEEVLPRVPVRRGAESKALGELADLLGAVIQQLNGLTAIQQKTRDALGKRSPNILHFREEVEKQIAILVAGIGFILEEMERWKQENTTTWGSEDSDDTTIL